MADRVKGITIEIGGDTQGLSKALSGVNKEISNTQKQLKDVERLLKMDPGNVELLEQRQRLLGDAVQETKTKLDALKKAEKQVQEQFQKGDVSQQQYDALQREIIATEQQLKKLEDQAKSSSVALSKIQATASKISAGAGKVSSAMAPVTAGIAGLGAAAVATIPATQELRSDLSKLEANAKENAVSADIAREAWRAFAIQSGETDSAVEAVSNLLQAGFTESNLQKAVEGLAGAAQRFPDTLKIESLADSLQETLATGEATGQFGELLDRLGIGAENFSDQLAACTTEAQKQDLALKTLADAGLNETYEAWAKNNEEMLANQEANLKLQESLSELAETVLPLVTRVTEAVTGLLDWFNSLDADTQNLIVTMLLLVAAISPIAKVVSVVSGAFTSFSGGVSLITSASAAASSAATTLSGVISTFFTFLTGTVVPGITSALSGLFAFLMANPVILIITAITAAIVALVTLIATKGDEIKEILSRVNEFLQGIFTRDWEEVFGPVLGGILNDFFVTAKGIWDNFMVICNGIIDFIQNIFAGNWEAVWTAVKDIFAGIFGLLVDIAKAPLNGIITMINAVIEAINTMIRGLNRIQVDIPDWVPGLGGKHFGINIPTISKLPLLAKGGILTQGSAIVGEAGPELLTVAGGRAVVQPLTGNSANKAGINIVMNNNFEGGYTPAMGEEISRDLVRAVNRALGRAY